MTIALCGLLIASGAQGASGLVAVRGPVVDLVQVPAETTVAELARVGFSPGLMSAGLGTVTPEQTYLDVGAGPSGADDGDSKWVLRASDLAHVSLSVPD